MAHGELKMTKEEMRAGFKQKRTLTQEEWAHPLEHQWVEELLAEGVCVVTDPWEYKDGFQCQRRRITGTGK